MKAIKTLALTPCEMGEGKKEWEYCLVLFNPQLSGPVNLNNTEFDALPYWEVGQLMGGN